MAMGACPGQIPMPCVPPALMVTATMVRACRYKRCISDPTQALGCDQNHWNICKSQEEHLKSTGFFSKIIGIRSKSTGTTSKTIDLELEKH